MGKRGAPKGNTNALKHGFYSRALSEAESLELEAAAGIEGLDNEIAVLRVKLRHLLEENPDRIDLQLLAMNMLMKLVKARYSITPEENASLKDAVNNVIREVALPLGLKFIT